MSILVQFLFLLCVFLVQIGQNVACNDGLGCTLGVFGIEVLGIP